MPRRIGSRGRPGAGAKTRGGFLFKAWRLRNGHTQFTACRALGLTYNKVNRWENSHTFPSLPLAVAIENLTGIPPRAWLEPLAGESEVDELMPRRSSA